MDEWLSQREAAQLLSVHVSAVPKMVRRGDLIRRAARPSLAPAEVLALRHARAAVGAARQSAEPSSGPRPPDGEHVWLRAAGAAAVLDVTSVAVPARARRGRLPLAESGGVRWYALEHLELVKGTDRARRSREI